jgi:dihydroorotate dehydrogenase electron transfer subunit
MTLLPMPPEDPPRASPDCHPATVLGNRIVADRYWRMSLAAPHVAQTARPGQFVLLTPSHSPEDSVVLPRPMAIYDTDASAGTIDILYGVVGFGTRQLTTFHIGDGITTVGPLGRPFEVAAGTRRLLLIGRGIGACSLTLLARAQVARGAEVVALLSGRHADAVIGAELCRSTGAQVLEVNDADGSSAPTALHARLLDLLDGEPPQFIASCGSDRLANLAQTLGRRWGTAVQVSVEAHMACGLGYCHGCSTGRQGDSVESPLVCTVGPVFELASP